MVLPDVISRDLRIVFSGTAVGTKSARTGAYYAGPGNQFWPTLHRVGLTPRQLVPAEYQRVLEYGIGLTDVCKVDAGSDRAIANDGFDVPRLLALLDRYPPAIVAFNGKKAGSVVLQRPVDYGSQPERIAGASVFVLPSTSGAARGFWDERHWRAVAQAAR
ncbi:MAG: mismatch-specific DNA-glycosylase [Actinobacteria bacterium]|nr:MAG: mismatch-specific DNA-glycosylase [Actinomycetota bacterium]